MRRARRRTLIAGATLAIVAAATVALVLTAGGGSQLPLHVFVRPQTAADRAALQDGLAPRPLPAAAHGTVRVAQTTPWGQRVVVELDDVRSRQSISARAAQPTTSFALGWGQFAGYGTLEDIGDGRAIGERYWGGATVPPRGITATPARTQIVMLVPNDVARVRFAYARGGPAQTVPVRGNVAAAQFDQPCCLIEPEMTWYSSGGSVLKHALVLPSWTG